jgi:phage terminase large subunit-like protein
LYQILKRGSVTRIDDLHIDITTAGEVNESQLCAEREEYCDQIEKGVIEDPHFYYRRWRADLSSVPWDSRAARVQANPSHEDNGGFLKDSKLEKLCLEAQNDPRKRNDYLRFNLNVWVDAARGVIDMQRWAENSGGVDLRKDPITVEELAGLWELIGKPCYAGVDLGGTKDLSALVLVFEPDEKCSEYTVLPFFWMPEDQVREREITDKVPYSEWIRRGLLYTTKGSATDYHAVADKIRWAARMFSVQCVVFDPWHAQYVSSDLIDEGYVCINLRQGWSVSEPTKMLLRLYVERKLRHANHPVLYWNASCLSLKCDDNDNIRPKKPDRSKESKRIDGISALVDALSRCCKHEDARSVYADQETAVI